jgi:hypothetical protein
MSIMAVQSEKFLHTYSFIMLRNDVQQWFSLLSRVDIMHAIIKDLFGYVPISIIMTPPSKESRKSWMDLINETV